MNLHEKAKFYLYDVPSRNKILDNNLSKNFYKSEKLGFTSINKGIFLPVRLRNDGSYWFNGGVLDADYNYIEASISPPGRVVGAYEFDTLEHSDTKVIYIGFLISHYGHFLLDCVARLWFVLKNSSLSAYKLAYSMPHDSILDKYWEFFDYCGIKKSQLLEVTEPTQFAEIIIPDVSISYNFYTDEHLKLFDLVIHNALQNKTFAKYDKVFLAMRSFSKEERKDVGGEEIIECFQSNGYKLIYTDACSLAELIYILQNCTHCACINGSLPINVVFMRTDAHLIVINKFNENDHFLMPALHMRCPYITYIDCHLTIFPAQWGAGPALLAVTEHLISFAKSNNMKLPKNKDIANDFLEYIRKYCARNPEIRNDGDRDIFEKMQETYRAVHSHLLSAMNDEAATTKRKVRHPFYLLIKKLSYELIYRISKSEKFKLKYLRYKSLLNQAEKVE